MIRELERIMCEEMLRTLALPSLEEGNLRGICLLFSTK